MWEVFCENFIEIFGGDAALERRRESKKKIDPRESASPVSGKNKKRQSTLDA